LQEKWPNFFIVGTVKGGTTSLWNYFKQIPGICMSKRKEPKYFARLLTGENQITNKNDYLAQFEDVKNAIAIGEASSVYLSDPVSAKLIHEKIPHAKIIISLRDPVERIFSGYFLRVARGRFQGTFVEFVKQELKNVPKNQEYKLGLQIGIYADDVKRFLYVFGQKQVKIIIFEEWINNVKKTVQDLLNFLEINYQIHDDFDDSAFNTYEQKKLGIGPKKLIIKTSTTMNFRDKKNSKSESDLLNKKLFDEKSQKPKMELNERELLKNYYKDDVRKLENLLGRKLPWKNFH